MAADDPLGGLHDKLDRDRREEGRTQHILFLLLGLFCIGLGTAAAITVDGAGLKLLAIALLALPGVVFVLGARWGRRYLLPEPLPDVDIEVSPRVVDRGAPVGVTVRLAEGAAPVLIGLRCEEWSWRLVATTDHGVDRNLTAKIRFEHWEPEPADGPTTVRFVVPPDQDRSGPRLRWVVVARRSKRPVARRTEVPILVR
jgi:hypothetical protein